MTRFWNQVGYRGGFCENMLEFPPYLTDPMPAGSKMDPQLAKDEPISDSDSTSGITYSRKA